jgi:uncharacterized membrane protein YccC
MTEPTQRKPRRSTRVSRALQQARERNSAQLAEQRRKEQRVNEALETYVDADEQIAAALAERDRKIAPHERAIAALREQFALDAATQEKVKGRAALAIHESDRTVEQVGELLEVGEKQARRLITLGRQATDHTQPGQRNPISGNGDEPARPPATGATTTSAGDAVHRANTTSSAGATGPDALSA